MKTRLKILLICLWILLVLGWTWAALTWYKVIPNWFWIEILCSQSSQKVENSVNEYLCKKYHDKEPCSPSIYTCVKTAAYNYECCIDGERCKMYLEYPDDMDKPIIYLYPTEEKNISVILWNTENLSHTYPKYDSNKWWNVIAQPNWNSCGGMGWCHAPRWRLDGLLLDSLYSWPSCSGGIPQQSSS